MAAETVVIEIKGVGVEKGKILKKMSLYNSEIGRIQDKAETDSHTKGDTHMHMQKHKSRSSQKLTLFISRMWVNVLLNYTDVPSACLIVN